MCLQEGLRTLVIAYKKIDSAMFKRYDTMMTKAKNALENREQKVNELAKMDKAT